MQWVGPSRRRTRDTRSGVDAGTVRELRNHGGEVLDRVARGESLIVTRDGAEVAELARCEVQKGKWPWRLYCCREGCIKPVFPASLAMVLPHERGEELVGVAMVCPSCGEVSINLVTQPHLDVPFFHDRVVRFVERPFGDARDLTVDPLERAQRRATGRLGAHAAPPSRPDHARTPHELVTDAALSYGRALLLFSAAHPHGAQTAAHASLA